MSRTNENFLSTSEKTNSLLNSQMDKTNNKELCSLQNARIDPLTQVIVCKRLAKMPKLFLAKRRQMRTLRIENAVETYTEDNAGLMATSTSPTLEFEYKANTFDEYTQKLENALTTLKNLKRNEYESTTALKVLRFLAQLINQPKEWISGAKLKLSEMKFPEMAMALMHCYKEKGYLVRQIVYVHSILIYNSMSNFTDHEFDKDGLLRMQLADAGFIEFACEILKDPSYLESLKKCYVISSPEETMINEDFNSYQKILYICDSALTILYNMANLPELKIHFRECNAINIIAEYTKLPTDAVILQFPEINQDEDFISSLKELRDIVRAVRVTSFLLLPLILNEDEDNILTTTASDVLPILSGMIQMYNRNDERFYGFSFIELVDGLSKLMVRGRTHKYIDKDLVDILLRILENPTQDESLLECVSNAILNVSFDEKVRKYLDNEHALEVITTVRDNSQSQLVQKNCEAILWTLNKTTLRRIATVQNTSGLPGHIMISYNRSVTAMCIKIRDRLKALRYTVWLDVDNINGGVLESMAEAIEKSSIVLICMNEQYKQSYYCRLEAEYATELRKPCIPCLMQPRFRPYGWLGIIKGAKIHADFATLPFEEAFSLLIREIETIQRNISTNDPGKDLTSSTANHLAVSPQKPPIPPKTVEIPIKMTSNKSVAINNWSTTEVTEWLKRTGLSNLERAFANIDGKLICRLYQMKHIAADSYYKLLDKYIDRIKLARMSDILKFDQELENLFQ